MNRKNEYESPGAGRRAALRRENRRGVAAGGVPQRVKVNAKAADECARLQAQRPQSLHELLSGGPFARMDFDFEGVRSPVREVEL